jgi:hypothetical protein
MHKLIELNFRKHLPLVDLKLHHLEAKLFSKTVSVFYHMQQHRCIYNYVCLVNVTLFQNFKKLLFALTEKALGTPPRTTTSCVGRGYFRSAYNAKHNWSPNRELHL